jgi:hypothetical protein
VTRESREDRDALEEECGRLRWFGSCAWVPVSLILVRYRGRAAPMLGCVRAVHCSFGGDVICMINDMLR